MQRLAFCALAAIGLSSCGYPGLSVNSAEKQADIAWIYGVFERNYAPAAWKEKTLGVNLEKAKQECLSGAEGITDGGEFIAHLNRCVNRFHDAHTRIIAGGTVLPEFAKVAYLGFRTETVRVDIANPPKDKDKEKNNKEGDKPQNAPAVTLALKVKDYLPTTSAEDFPVKAGDFILEVNGVSVAEYLARELIPYSNLGNENSSLVVAGESFPLRTTHENHLPTEEAVTLKILRDESTFTVQIPWTVKDLLAFTSEQKLAQDAKAASDKEKSKDKKTTQTLALSWDGDELINNFWTFLTKFRNSPGQRVSLLLQNSFRFYNFGPTLQFLDKLAADEKKAEKMPVEEAISAPSLKVDNASFPARVFLLEDGSRIGYVRVESFELGDEDMKNFASLNETFTKMKVKGVIYDLLNNGGGSLVAGLRMANSLTSKDLHYPSMQLALNDNWMNSFRADSLYSPGGAGSDARRTMASHVYASLQEDARAGLRLSHPISATELDPFLLNESKTLCAKTGKCLDSGVKKVLLVNEMCASMCDIFASVFRDNQLGTIVGSQTMGAGGNVVMHGNSPITNVILRQTESLIVDVNGAYLENQGVQPNEAIDTLADSAKKYSATYKKALDLLK